MELFLHFPVIHGLFLINKAQGQLLTFYDLGAKGKITLKLILNEWREREKESVDRIHLICENDQWLAPVNTVMELRVA
jgi:hypothetical protein